MDEEIWKPILGYEGIYEASNLGRIKSCKEKTTYTQKHGIRHWGQRILRPKGETYATGYRVSLWKDGKCKDFLVARLVATAFLGPSDLTVNHIDGNRFNNRIENLEWCSLKENIQKGFEIGLYKRNCKPITIINEKTGEKHNFRSMSECCKFLGKNHDFVSCHIKQNKKIEGYTIIKDYEHD